MEETSSRLLQSCYVTLFPTLYQLYCSTPLSALAPWGGWGQCGVFTPFRNLQGTVADVCVLGPVSSWAGAQICGQMQPRSPCKTHGVMWHEISQVKPAPGLQGCAPRAADTVGSRGGLATPCTRNPLRNGGCCVGARSLRSSALAQIQDQAMPGNSSASAQQRSLPLL